MTEKRQEYLKAEQERQERHEQRMKRLSSRGPSKSSSRSTSQRPRPGDESDTAGLRPHFRRNTSFPNRSTPDLQHSGRPENLGPHYYDENDEWYPYSPPSRSQTLPKPPMGYDYR